MKQIRFEGISFEEMTKVAELFKRGGPYWEWCWFTYEGTSTSCNMTIGFDAGSRQGHKKDVPEIIRKVAEALN